VQTEPGTQRGLRPLRALLFFQSTTKEGLPMPQEPA
jgi:hypothetical protein